MNIVPLLLLQLTTIFVAGLEKSPIKELRTKAPDVALPNLKWQPETKENCRHQYFRKPVLVPNCEPKFIRNKICFGQCNSIYIPQVGKNFKDCKACIPSEWTNKTITLKCQIDGVKKNVYKNLTLVHRCRCQEVECNRR